MLWVGMGEHRSLMMVMVYVWVQIRRKMLGSGAFKICYVTIYHKYVEKLSTSTARDPPEGLGVTDECRSSQDCC